MTALWEALSQLGFQELVCFAIALLIAFAFEFINGFHDTANAVTTVIYTGTLSPTRAVLYSGVCNFLGVLLGGTAVAFAIVNLLPIDLLIENSSIRSVVAFENMHQMPCTALAAIVPTPPREEGCPPGHESHSRIK